jgi:choline dehydrogenase-like flavoprotein
VLAWPRKDFLSSTTKIRMRDHFDVIIIGTGAGGGSLLNRIAPSGRRILVLERGPFLPREKDNWNYHGSFKYYSSETMYNREGGEIHPGFCYYVGGNTKVYGAALFRLREKDFEKFRHKDGFSPEWPLKYSDFEAYYDQAEELFQVHGKAGEDPTDPPRKKDYPFPPISHEPRIKEVFEILKARGMKPYPAPMGVRLNEAFQHLSPCIRCDTCDGYPCMVHAKSDAEICAVRPMMAEPNVTLITEAKVLRLHTSRSGREVTGVVAEFQGRQAMFSADIVVVSCGAVNSSALLLRSANDRHPGGLGNNSSGLVGRNLMKHVLGSLVGVSTLKPNPSKFQKTMAINDFYWGEPGYDFPMGNIQLMGKTVIEGLIGQEAKYTPLTIEEVAKNSIDWWLTTEDLPDPRNQVRVEGDQRIVIDYTENNSEPFDRLTNRWKGILKEIGCGCHIVPQANYFSPKSGYFATKMPMQSLGHQVGTCVFGEDPRTSVLDLNCRTHDVDNLYVVDGSFFVSSGAVNPTLTIIANALRVGDHLLERFGVATSTIDRMRSPNINVTSQKNRESMLVK